MVRVVNCHAGFFPWNCFYGVRSNSVTPTSDSGSSSGLYSLVCLYERLMPGSQDIKGEECSDSAIPNSLTVGSSL